MKKDLQKKIDLSIKILQATCGDDVVELAYSGGKDSDVILQLAKEAGIKYRAIYKNTTIDPPGTIKHAKEMGAEVVKPKRTFFQLIEKKGYPNRNCRFCCSELKEYQYDKSLKKVVMGIRRSESSKRAARYNDPTECLGTKKKPYEAIYPLLDWTTEDVQEYILDRGIKCAPVYYDKEGNFHAERRLGCMCCPIAYYKKRICEFMEHPNMVKAYIKSGKKYMDTHPQSELKEKYGDAYTYFYRNVFCDSEEKFNQFDNSLFGKPDYKSLLEDFFGIKL